MRTLGLASAMLLLGTSIGQAQWQSQSSGTTARLRGLSVVDEQTAWVTGQAGTCLRTTDGGTTWIVRPIPDTSTLDFRDVHGFDAQTAAVLSAGPGDLSRI